MKGVSLVMCCYNSTSRLTPTIKAINELTVRDDIPWEFIIVDNGSVDCTAETATRLLSSDARKITKIVFEKKLGLRNARIKGITESKYGVISFIDDDNWICREWINLVYEIMSNHPEVGACGGYGLPSFQSTPPHWFEKYMECYAVGPQGTSTGYVPDTRGFLWGAGLTIRKSAWDEIVENGFNFSLSGRTGSNLSSGEDSEICLALRCYGWRLWYDERLIYHHYLSNSRLSWKYLKQLVRGFGAANVVLDTYKHYINDNVFDQPNLGNLWVYEIVDLMKDKYKNLFSRGTKGVGSQYELQFNTNLGKLLSIIKLRSRYDSLVAEIFMFWKGSKLYLERQNLILVNADPLLQERDRTILVLKKRISELENSLSWRITAPLRKVFDFLVHR